MSIFFSLLLFCHFFFYRFPLRRVRVFTFIHILIKRMICFAFLLWLPRLFFNRFQLRRFFFWLSWWFWCWSHWRFIWLRRSNQRLRFWRCNVWRFLNKHPSLRFPSFFRSYTANNKFLNPKSAFC